MQTSLPLVIIDNGKFDGKNLSLTGLEKTFFEDILKQEGVKSVKKVLVLTADGTGKLYLQVKGEKFRTLNVTYPDGKIW